jgi:hypothetical protein
MVLGLDHRTLLRRCAASSITAVLKIFMILAAHSWKLPASTMVGRSGQRILTKAG